MEMEVPGIIAKTEDQPVLEPFDVGIGKAFPALVQDQLGPRGKNIAQLGPCINAPEFVLLSGGGTPSEFEGELNAMELKLTALETVHIPDLLAHRFGPIQGDHIGIIGIDGITQAKTQPEIPILIEGKVLDKAQLQAIGEVPLAKLLRPIQ